MTSSKKLVAVLVTGFLILSPEILSSKSFADGDAGSRERAGLKAFLWNTGSFSQIDPKGVQLAPEVASKFNIRSNGNSQTFVSAAASPGPYAAAIAQRVEVEYWNADRDQVKRFTSADRGVVQTLSLDKSGKISALTVCQGAILMSPGGCYSITPDVCAAAENKLSDSNFKKLAECENTLGAAHQAIFGAMNSKTYTQAVTENMQALTHVSKTSKIAAPTVIEDSVGKYYGANLQSAYAGNWGQDFIMLGALKGMCDQVVKNKGMELPSYVDPKFVYPGSPDASSGAIDSNPAVNNGTNAKPLPHSSAVGESGNHTQDVVGAH